MSELLAQAEAIADEVAALRRDLHHHPAFDLDEAALPIGVALLAGTARPLLEPDASRGSGRAAPAPQRLSLRASSTTVRAGGGW